MKNKVFSILIYCLIFGFLFGTIPCSASDTSVEAQDLFEDILKYHGAEEDIQGWIDGYLTQNAGTGSEWYAFALSGYGDYDFTSYETALLDYLAKNKVGSASSRLKYAFCLAAIRLSLSGDDFSSFGPKG